MSSYNTRLKNRLAATLIVVVAMMTGPAIAGDADAGSAKAATCAACHGMDGNSVNPLWPSLAGQHSSYIVDTLTAFKKGSRSDVLMNAQAMMLSDTDMDDLAAYFATKAPAKRTANPALVSAGERLYRGGNAKDQTSACIACHGPAGRGNSPAGYPSLTGQHAAYTAKQLNDYQAGKRTSDGDTQIMRNIAADLSQDEINSVSAYIQGLR